MKTNHLFQSNKGHLALSSSIQLILFISTSLSTFGDCPSTKINLQKIVHLERDWKSQCRTHLSSWARIIGGVFSWPFFLVFRFFLTISTRMLETLDYLDGKNYQFTKQERKILFGAALISAKIAYCVGNFSSGLFVYFGRCGLYKLGSIWCSTQRVSEVGSLVSYIISNPRSQVWTISLSKKILSPD